VDHRVEPPAWLPQGAAPEAADTEADGSPEVEDTQAAEDSNAAAEAPPEEFANGNGHDSTYSYSSADSYRYSDDNSFAEGTSYRSPFTPHRPAGSDYEPSYSGYPADDEAGNTLPVTSYDGNLPAHGLAPGSDLPPRDLPATGLIDPDMPEVGFPHAAADYADTTTAAYNDPAAIPYPAAEPLAAAGTTTGADSESGDKGSSSGGDKGSSFGSPDSGRGPEPTVADRGKAIGAAAAATVGGITAALRSGKQRSAVRFSRGSSATRSTRSATPKPTRSATVKPTRRATGNATRPVTGQPRRANLVIARVEPWSVMKFSFLISLVLWLVMFVAVALLYYALSSLGVFAALQRTLASVTSSQGSAGVDLTKWTSATRVLGYTMLLGAVNVVLITAISTVSAVIYNLVTHLGGGIEVTLKETE
jgi:Transmembrane domain of unknown function (DUF3566)